MRLRTLCVMFSCVAIAACGKKDTPPPPATDAAPAAVDPTEEPSEEEPTTDEAPAAVDPAVLARGELIANVSGCALCHTPFGPQGPELDKLWAGGLEVPEAFGTWRSPNITQDAKTGIGGWTDEQIIAATREGKRPDGSQLYPIMPYLFYNTMSDDDAKALVAYMRTIAPIEHAVAGNTDLKLPKIPAPPPKGAPPADDPLARGAYLAALMHCAACHTPMTEKGPDMSRAFAGGMEFEIAAFGEGVLYAPNITPHVETGVGAWSDEELAASMTKMQRRDGSPIVGPMAMYGPAWGRLAAAEIDDVVKFLRSLPPQEHQVPKSTFVPRGAPPADPGE